MKDPSTIEYQLFRPSSSEVPSPSVSPQSAYPSFTQFPGIEPSLSEPASQEVSE